MSVGIEEQIRRMLQAITINTALPRYIEDLSILLEDTLYFDICQRIFPELRMKIIKIGQNQFLTPPEKVQHLIDLLSKELSLDLSGIKGEEILQGYYAHIHHFLGILWKFSQYQFSKSSQSMRVRSQQISNDEKDIENYPRSARDRNNIQYNVENQNPHRSESNESEEPDSQRKSSSEYRYSKELKQKRSEEEERKNVYQSLLNIMWGQKNRMNKAAIRNNKKNKHDDLKQAKNKYKSYLQGYAKETKAKRNRQSIKKQKRPKSSAHFQLPPEDFEKIDNFFQSFAYKFRDQKENFLRKIKKVIKDQELDRMCYNNRIEREKNKEIETLTKKEIGRITNEHKIRSDLLKEKLNSDNECIHLMKKQYEKYLRNQKKQLKQTKKKELNNIVDYVDQQNRKVLMEFQDGGRIQKLILNMYKRY